MALTMLAVLMRLFRALGSVAAPVDEQGRRLPETAPAVADLDLAAGLALLICVPVRHLVVEPQRGEQRGGPVPSGQAGGWPGRHSRTCTGSAGRADST
jgi:hypothetical protein